MITFYTAAELSAGRAFRAEMPELQLLTDRQMAALVRYAHTNPAPERTTSDVIAMQRPDDDPENPVTISTVPQIIALAERLGDATSLDPFSWSARTDEDRVLYVDNTEAAATPAEILAAWKWLLSDQRARELGEIQDTGVYLGGALVDLLADDGGEQTTAPVRDLEPAERDRALASLIVTAAALRRRLHETGVAIVTLIADNAADQRNGSDL